jgi:isoleucyl-tRNA synthetase
MSLKYKEFNQLNLPGLEKEILSLWEQEKAFEKSISLRSGATPFVFYEGPPSANGMPGIHHVISRTLKDLVCRYKTMKGFKVSRKAGWDTHGLPIELGVEKELGITKEDIGTKISVEDYNAKCREAVVRFKDKWDDITKKMGYWVDLNDPYVTYHNEYIETLWWLLQQLYKKGLLYESISIQPYSPAAGTGLSSHELNQPGTYKNVKDTSATVMFKAIDNEKSAPLFKASEGKEVFLMAWTTTPWTLPSNLGLTVGSEITYVLIQTFNPYTALPINVVLAKDLVASYFKAEEENGDFTAFTPGQKNIPWKVLASFKGRELEGIQYEQLLPYEANNLNAIVSITPNAKPFRILLGDFVTTQDGTGIVHTAPAFGADDYKVGKKYGIGILTMVDREGKFVEGLGEFSHRYVKNYKDEKEYADVNVDICIKLKKENRAFKVEKYEHSYPHCWRTDKPILYYPLDAWFIRTTALKDKMVALNKTINWKPASTGEGRFGNWLENMVDWNLSRSRFWGTPLPIWKTEDGEEEKCIGTVEELKAACKLAIEKGIMPFEKGMKGVDDIEAYIEKITSDLHKPYVDEIILVSDSGKPMKRVPDLIDVWFDSGAMPYAQWGLDHEKVRKGVKYPFKLPAGVNNFEDLFPADFIAEGVDQTRGWFYTLHAISSLLYENIAYKTVVSNGLVLDKNGNKMSKRLGNVVDPFQTIDQYGADATRWYLITNASPWDNLKFDIEGIKEVQRKFFGTLYNTYQFFALYANVDGFSFSEREIPLAERPEIDRWILSSLHTLVKKVNEEMDHYEPTQAGRLIEDFVDRELSNWYVRLCRRRFWKGEYESDKISAYQTLYECMETLLRLIAPIAPFFSDLLFRELNAVTKRIDSQSIHHSNFPTSNENKIDAYLEERMMLAQEACSLVLSIRKKVNIKVRQPLQKILIPILNENMKAQFQKVEELIKTEVNVKEVEYLSSDNTFIQKSIKPDFKLLGKKLGANMKAAAAALSNLSQEEITQLERNGNITLNIGGNSIEILSSEVSVLSEDVPGWQVASNGEITVALDITVTDQLLYEGVARELVNRIQKIRKESGLALTDRIEVKLGNAEKLTDSISEYKSYICAEILADSLTLDPGLTGGVEVEVNDTQIIIHLVKKGG